MIDLNDIKYYTENLNQQILFVIDEFKDEYSEWYTFLQPLGKWIYYISIAFSIIALVEIIYCGLYSIIKCGVAELKDEQKGIYISYFAGTRKQKIVIVKKKYFKMLSSGKYDYYCLSYLRRCFGLIDTESLVVSSVLALFYIPLAVLALLEAVFKYLYGLLVYFIVAIVEKILYFPLKFIRNTVFLPFALVLWKKQSNEQVCPHCFKKYEFPFMKCNNPECKNTFLGIKPGKYGVFHFKCECGEYMNILPSFQRSPLTNEFLVKKSEEYRKFLKKLFPRYNFTCPHCNAQIKTSLNNQKFIVVFGNNNSGKSSLISSALCGLSEKWVLDGIFSAPYIYPNDKYMALMNCYKNYSEMNNNSIDMYSLQTRHRFTSRIDTLNIIEISADTVINNNYGNYTPALGVANGFIFLFDPVNELKRDKEYSADKINLSFLQFYYQMNGLIPGTHIDVPFIFVISKSDLWTKEMNNIYKNSTEFQSMLKNLKEQFSNFKFYPINCKGKDNKIYEMFDFILQFGNENIISKKINMLLPNSEQKVDKLWKLKEKNTISKILRGR